MKSAAGKIVVSVVAVLTILIGIDVFRTEREPRSFRDRFLRVAPSLVRNRATVGQCQQELKKLGLPIYLKGPDLESQEQYVRVSAQTEQWWNLNAKKFAGDIFFENGRAVKYEFLIWDGGTF